MVSPLTDRIYAAGGYTSGGSKESAGSKRKNDQTASPPKRSHTDPTTAANTSTTTAMGATPAAGSKSGSSGYAADNEQIITAPPCYVDFLQCDSARRGGAPSNREDTKRRKVAQVLFDAAKAKDYIKEVGRLVPQVRRNAPSRLLPESTGIDMSRVTLIQSSKISMSELMPPRPILDLVALCDTAVSSIVKECSSLYVQPMNENEKSDDTKTDPDEAESVTSSVTDTEGDLNTSGQEDNSEVKSRSGMTMGDALSICQQPRVIILVSNPFSTVHVNAAYLELTGLSAVRLLGQPFQDMLADEKWTALMNNDLDEEFDVMRLHEMVVGLRCSSVKHGSMRCKLFISPIGGSFEGNASHVAIGMQLVQGRPRGARNSSPEPAFSVSG